MKLWSVALSSAIVAYFLKLVISESYPILRAAAILPVYGALYFGGTFFCGLMRRRPRFGQ